MNQLDPAESGWRVRVALLGRCDDDLRELLFASLSALAVKVEWVDALRDADLLVVSVATTDPSAVALARQVVGETPIVAVLPSRDPEQACRVLSSGATAFYALDTPRLRLRAVLLSVLGDRLALLRSLV